MRLSEEDVHAIRSQADVVDIVGRYLPLVKKGKSYAAVCPFHDDHSPSLSLSQDKQIYKCFVCNAGGNVFTFVQNYENISFPEAVAKVAEYIGYKLEYDPNEFTKKQDPYKAAGYKVMDEAIRFMMYTLNLSSSTLEKDYLVKRGINDKLIETFEIGYNGPNNQLYKFLHAKGYEEKELISTNLVRISENGLNDTFASRITFPIHDGNGNPVGFTARTLNPEIPSKYINSTETDFYVKGKIVYNLHRAKPHAKKVNATILVEGVTDVLALARAGIYNTCATLGTSGTSDQLKQLKACGSRIIFCYDGDSAGQSATYRVGKIAKELGFEVLVVENKTGKDPDEIIENFGIEKLQAMIEKPQEWMEFIFDYFRSKNELENYSEKKEFAQAVMEEIKLLKNDFDRQNFTHRLSQLTGFSFSSLAPTSPTNENPKSQRILRKATKVPRPNDGRDVAEKIILSQMLLSKEACEIFKNELGFMTSKNHQKIAMMVLEEYRVQDTIHLADFLDKVEEKEIILSLSMEEEFPKEYHEEILLGAIQRVKRALIEEKVRDIKRKLSEPNSKENQEILMQEYSNSLKEKRMIIDEENSKKQ